MEKDNHQVQLSSPDQLDQLIKSTPSMEWFALTGLILIAFLVFIWSVFGTVTVKVQGNGILIQPGGVFNIVSFNYGKLSRILVNVGDFVKEGQVVATVSQPNLEFKLKHQKSQLKELYHQRRNLFLLKSKDAISKLKETNTNISKIKSAIKQLEEKIAFSSTIKSSYTGKILEIMADEGTLIRVGDPLINLELISEIGQEHLEAVIYLPPTEGKKVINDMVVNINPSTVQKEQYGVLIGKVTAVSEFPSTFSGMMRILKNETLANSLSSKGAPLEIRAELAKSKSTVSGYEWSSLMGPPIKLNSGTLCKVSIIIKKERPIYYVMPFLKDFLN
ncbi:MAG: NHLP bacteriocin system secretion protein [bacterium]|nr:NHLP bacteriocin system secretion protein [bacterium]